nr:IS3 family transposase [Nocardioides daedukensis]
MVRKFKVSERRACKVTGQHRSSNRYVPVPSDFEQRLVAAMNKIADRYPRFGYRRVHALLVADGWEVNVKRVERLWRREGLRVPPPRSKASGQKALGTDAHSLWMLPATSQGHVWSYDFMSLRTAKGAGLRVLNVIDEFTRICVGAHVGYSIGATEVRHVLERIFEDHGRPQMIRSDNGREFIAASLLNWLKDDQGVAPVQVAKASPQQNGFIERFNGSMRDELLNREVFHSLAEARVVIGQWVEHYNHERPHSGLQMRTPIGYAAYIATQPSLSTAPCERGE